MLGLHMPSHCTRSSRSRHMQLRVLCMAGDRRRCLLTSGRRWLREEQTRASSCTPVGCPASHLGPARNERQEAEVHPSNRSGQSELGYLVWGCIAISNMLQQCDIRAYRKSRKSESGERDAPSRKTGGCFCALGSRVPLTPLLYAKRQLVRSGQGLFRTVFRAQKDGNGSEICSSQERDVIPFFGFHSTL